MARTAVAEKERTTIMTSGTLLKRVSSQVLKHDDNQSNFITRALVNQLENQYHDYEIRDVLEAEGYHF